MLVKERTMTSRPESLESIWRRKCGPEPPWLTEGLFEHGFRWGMLDQARHDIKLIWECKFGPIPKTLAERLNASMDFEELERVMLAVFTLDRPDEFVL
jgi:hypothetical protein